MADRKIKCTIRPRQTIYPNKNTVASVDNFCIFSAEFVDTKDDSPKPVINGRGEITIKGNPPKFEIGNLYNVVLREIDDAKWGKQYQLLFMNEEVRMSSEKDKKIFLERILPYATVQDLYAAYPDPFEIIENEDVQSLTKVKGIKLARALNIIDRFKQTIDYSEVYVELDALGLTDLMIKKLCETYGSPKTLLQKYRENPYVIADDVDGIGFVRADEMALAYGTKIDSPLRITAYIDYYLNDMAQAGCSWVKTKDLMRSCVEKLSVPDVKLIGKTINEMDLWKTKDYSRIGLMRYYNLEKNIAEEIMRIKTAESVTVYHDWENTVSQIEKSIGFEYTDEQKKGVHTVLTNNIVLLTGLGGTGKTTVTKAMMAVLSRYEVAQCALAGRAARRMAELSGRDASTIHRLLKFNATTRQFELNKNNPLPYDVVIVDEASMIGGQLFYDLVSAIKTGSKLVIVGDYGQLESIGACNIFHDLLNSGNIPVVKLTKIHRQAQKSAIITDSINVRNNKHIIESSFTGKEIRGELHDLELDIARDGQTTLMRVLKQYAKELENVGNDILRLQIIVPQKDRGDICTFRINNAIQSIYNADGSNPVEISMAKDTKYLLKEGDKVICIKNNYKALDLEGNETPIFNGSIGVIDRINLDEKKMVVNFSDIGRVILGQSDWKSIQLGYAITVHKMQGSSCNTIIIGLDFSCFVMLTAEMLYTAISRAEKYCVLVGENKAIRYATEKTNIPHKTTFLKEFLHKMSNDALEESIPF